MTIKQDKGRTPWRGQRRRWRHSRQPVSPLLCPLYWHRLGALVTGNCQLAGDNVYSLLVSGDNLLSGTTHYHQTIDLHWNVIWLSARFADCHSCVCQTVTRLSVSLLLGSLPISVISAPKCCQDITTGLESL